MYFIRFLKNLRIGVRKREIIHLVTPFGSLVYGIIPEESLDLLKALIFGALIITSVLIAFNGIKFSKNVFSGKLNQIEIPELQEFTNKMGLKLSTNPFWEKDNKKIKAWARGTAKNPKIIFGKDYLKSLTGEEKLFVAGHEFYHLNGHEILHYLIILFPMAIFVFYISSTLHVPDEIMYAGIIGIVICGMCFIKRSFESIADINGATYVNRESAVNALKKSSDGNMDKSYYSHPSINARIKNLDNYYKQQK